MQKKNKSQEKKRKTKHSFSADTKLQFDQVRRKITAYLKKNIVYLKINNFKSQNDRYLSSRKTVYRPNYYNPNFFWIVTVQDCTKNSPAFRPVKALNFFELLRSG